MLQIAARGLVPGLLIIVAWVQHYRAHAYDQSSWIGCGFGMFATLDNHTSRFVQAKWIDSTGASVVSIPPDLRPLVDSVCVVPSQENLDRLCESIVHNQRAKGNAQSRSLEVSLFRVRFDPISNRMTANRSLTAHAHE